MYWDWVERPLQTEVVRIPGAGPEPCNTLAFLRCRFDWSQWPPQQESDELRMGFHTRSQFQIDGFRQSELAWYQRNTKVSATARIRTLTATEETFFRMGVDWITPVLAASGTIGFTLQLSMGVDEGDFGFEVDVSAYVLCYEPRVELPPSGPPGLMLGGWPEMAAPALRQWRAKRKK